MLALCNFSVYPANSPRTVCFAADNALLCVLERSLLKCTLSAPAAAAALNDAARSCGIHYNALQCKERIDRERGRDGERGGVHIQFGLAVV